MRLRQRLRLDDGNTVERATAHLETYPSGEITNVRAHPSGRRLRVRLTLYDRLPAPVDEGVQLGSIWSGEEVGVAKTGLCHAERFEEPTFGKICPCRSGGSRRCDSTFGQTEVAVGVGCPEASGRSQEANTAKNLVLVVAVGFKVIACVTPKAAAMRKQVTNGDFSRRIRVGEPELRIEIADLGVPGNDSIAHQGRHDGRCDGFRKRCDLEDGIGIDQPRLADFSYSETLEINNFVVEDDANRKTGDIAALDDVIRQSVERWQRGCDLLRCDPFRQRGEIRPGERHGDAEHKN